LEIAPGGAYIQNASDTVKQVTKMIRNAKFWITMTVFQVVFGLMVFSITREYYARDSNKAGADPTVKRQFIDPAQFGASASSWPIIEDPAEISRQADEYFANKQYDRAAGMYERLLVYTPNNADTYNNLGITLHYLGRSTEALRKLNEGVVVDPSYQRIWLTLGYVSSQLGQTEQARSALTTSVQLGADNEVGQSAARMLENLPVRPE
jgi:tetratricopeptide (TPR) repeat protein